MESSTGNAATTRREVGVGPMPQPWPEDDRLDPELLANGDRRNVIDRYRYWHLDAIRADLAATAHPFHVAIENWQHDFNIGAVVRNANAFGAAGVHVIGNRRWNRRGAMKTEAYLDVHHHEQIATFIEWCAATHLPIVGIDNLPGAVDMRVAEIPQKVALLFGQEGPGLSAAARTATTCVVSIPQFGSTRSINAGAASAIAMFEWVRRHVV